MPSRFEPWATRGRTAKAQAEAAAQHAQARGVNKAKPPPALLVVTTLSSAASSPSLLRGENSLGKKRRRVAALERRGTLPQALAAKETRYINTDLELESPADLAPLVAAFESFKMFALWHEQIKDGLWKAVFETYRFHRAPEPSIRDFVRSIERLDGEARKLWDGCSKRVFGIGFECGTVPFSHSDELTVKTVGLVANLGAGVVITLYGKPTKTTKVKANPKQG